MQLQNRKSNRLQNYDYSTAGAYFITICTKNKAKILCEIVGGGAPSSTPSRVGAGVPSSTHYRVGGGALDAPQIILSPLGKTVEKYILSSEHIKGISVSKYVIMPNHTYCQLYFLHRIGYLFRKGYQVQLSLPLWICAKNVLVYRAAGEADHPIGTMKLFPPLVQPI